MSRTGRLAAWLGRRGRWTRLALAFLGGILTVGALPPLHIVPLLWISLPILLWLLDGVAGKRGAFVVGWAFGTGYFAAGLYWVSNALLVDAARFGWLIPFAIGGLGLGLGLFFGLLTLGVHVTRLRGLARVAAFAALWMVLELVRGWVLTGFPWNLLGSVWSAWPSLSQGAAVVGTYGLSLITALLATLPALIGWAGMGHGGRRAALALSAGGIVLIGVGGLVGGWHIPAGPAPMVDGVRLRLVQPDIPQADKWRADRRMANLRAYLALSMAPSKEPVTDVIWGETALPYALDGVHDAELRKAVAEGLSSTNPLRPDPLLITGVVRQTPMGQEPFKVWNSMVALDRTGTPRGWYDKSHLVPFGEYVPFRSVLPLTKITAGAVDFTPGPGRVTMELPGLPPVSPLICYEVIFPGHVMPQPEPGSERPQWMLNLTNDGWYGASSEPYQHYATARMRAIEEGVPLVRVANTGISAIVDPWGREVVRLDAGQKGFVDGPLPKAAGMTLYAVLGNSVPLGLGVLVLGFALLGGRRQRRAPAA